MLSTHPNSLETPFPATVHGEKQKMGDIYHNRWIYNLSIDLLSTVLAPYLAAPLLSYFPVSSEHWDGYKANSLQLISSFISA